MDPKIDLLSGDDFSYPKAEPSLALVPVGGPKAVIAQSQQSALVLFDMFSDGNTQLNPINTQNANPAGQSNPSTPNYQQQPSLQPPQFEVFANGNSPTAGFNQTDQSFYAQGSGTVWRSQIARSQQSSSPSYGAQTGGSLPPPPWEAPALENSQASDSPSAQPAQLPPESVTPSQFMPTGMLTQSPYTMGNEQNTRMYKPQVAAGHLPGMNGHHSLQPNQMMGVALQPMQVGGPFMAMMMVPQQMQAGPMGNKYSQQTYGSGQMAAVANGYGPQGMQYVDQRVYGLSFRDGGTINNYSSSKSTPSYGPPMKPSKPEDKLFRDLVHIARVKKSGQDRAGII